MATRLQIARARVKVALAERSGEEVPADVVALANSDLRTAEKPPRPWQQQVSATPGDVAGADSPEPSEPRTDAPETDHPFTPSDVHDRWAEEVAKSTAATNRAIEGILERAGRGAIECVVVGRSAFGDHVLDERVGNIWQKLPLRIGGATLLGTAGLRSDGTHRTGKHAFYGNALESVPHDPHSVLQGPLDLGIVVIRSTGDEAEEDGTGADSSARSAPAQR